MIPEDRDESAPESACLMSEFCDAFCMHHKITKVDLPYAGKFHCPILLSRSDESLAPIAASLKHCYGKGADGWKAIVERVVQPRLLPEEG